MTILLNEILCVTSIYFGNKVTTFSREFIKCFGLMISFLNVRPSGSNRSMIKKHVTLPVALNYIAKNILGRSLDSIHIKYLYYIVTVYENGSLYNSCAEYNRGYSRKTTIGSTNYMASALIAIHMLNIHGIINPMANFMHLPFEIIGGNRYIHIKARVQEAIGYVTKVQTELKKDMNNNTVESIYVNCLYWLNKSTSQNTNNINNVIDRMIDCLDGPINYKKIIKYIKSTDIVNIYPAIYKIHTICFILRNLESIFNRIDKYDVYSIV